LVGTTLGYIGDVFGAAGLEPKQLAPELLPSGQRRSLVEEFYAGVDWSSSRAISRVLSAYEHILFDVRDEEEKQRLVRSLRVDGFEVDDNGRVSSPAALDLGIDAGAIRDVEALAGYERRIVESITDDPELAIGSSKELVEAIAKLLLHDAGVEPDPNWSAERLFKEALRTLDLSIESVEDERAGAESIRKVLRSLHQTVVGTAELRNRFGTGHGRPRRSGLGPRHARLVAGAALTLARFLLDTRAERRAGSTRSSQSSRTAGAS
jgi:hypothetical protein